LVGLVFTLLITINKAAGSAAIFRGQHAAGWRLKTGA
jgi:hypothetical protein